MDWEVVSYSANEHSTTDNVRVLSESSLSL